MPNVVPPTPGRSRNMAAIRRSNTTPELSLRSELHRRGFRFRKDLRVDVGDRWVRPDIVFTRRRIAVFVDGCFWHVCPEHGRAPRVNDAYWGPKLERTRHRDQRDTAVLQEHGWTVIRIWEHENLQDAVAVVEVALTQGYAPGSSPPRQAMTAHEKTTRP
jgi:DNA mismatch endonuclease (patch repair protein)